MTFYDKLSGMRRLLAFVMFAALFATAAELNHFYLVIDRETYAAIEGSDFLKLEFAAFEKRTTVQTDKTYTRSTSMGLTPTSSFSMPWERSASPVRAALASAWTAPPLSRRWLPPRGI